MKEKTLPSFRKSLLTSADFGVGSAGLSGASRSREPRNAEDRIKVKRRFLFAHINIKFGLYSPLPSLHLSDEVNGRRKHLKGLNFMLLFFFVMFIDLRHISHMVKMVKMLSRFHWAGLPC